MRKSNFFIGIIFTGLLGATAMADPGPTKPTLTPKVGLSNFTGILGFEWQKGPLGLSFGLPYSGGVRYYFRPDGHSWFVGLYGSGGSFEDDETKDGITYTDRSWIG